MSRLADEIRELVADPSVSDHYGRWGSLHPTQRKMIRKLCDLCDVFEQEADRANMEIDRLKKGWTADIVLTAYAKAEEIKEFEEKLKVCCGNNTDAPIIWVKGTTDNLVKEMTEETT